MIKSSINSAGLECVLSKCRTRSVFLTPICPLLIYDKSLENYIPSRLPSTDNPDLSQIKRIDSRERSEASRALVNCPLMP